MLPPPFTPQNKVKHYFDATHSRTLYRVLSPNGLTVAEGIDSEGVARQVACLDQLVDKYQYLVTLAEWNFWHGKYDLPWSTPGYEELASDKDGQYEVTYPGLPAEAGLLLEMNDLRDYLVPPKGPN